jgi:hypothetical protein
MNISASGKDTALPFLKNSACRGEVIATITANNDHMSKPCESSVRISAVARASKKPPTRVKQASTTSAFGVYLLRSSLSHFIRVFRTLKILLINFESFSAGFVLKPNAAGGSKAYSSNCEVYLDLVMIFSPGDQSG